MIVEVMGEKVISSSPECTNVEEICRLYYPECTLPPHPHSHTSIKKQCWNSQRNRLHCTAAHYATRPILPQSSGMCFACSLPVLTVQHHMQGCPSPTLSLFQFWHFLSVPAFLSPSVEVRSPLYHCNCPRAAILTFTSCTGVFTNSSWHSSCDPWS